MKPENDLHEDDLSDEEFVSSLMNAAKQPMPAPDPEFLARLRERSTEAFLESAEDHGARSRSRETSEEPGPADKTELSTRSQSRETSDSAATAGGTEFSRIRLRGRWRTSITFKVVSAAAAVVIVVLVALWPFGPQHNSGLAFGGALDRIAKAKSLHLKITRDGKDGEIWYAGPNRFRWDRADGTSTIARDEAAWKVDEQQNLAVREPAESELGRLRNQSGLDLLKLLDAERASNASAALERDGTGPVETIERDGHKLLHYRIDLKNEPQRLILDAFVDAKTEWIESLELSAERNGRLEPVAELNVLAVNAPIADDKFVVRDTLTEDGRIGKIAEIQGVVALKPVLHERWTPVCGKTLLKPGDWLRTDNRGANAATIRLVKQTQVIIGPGSLVELAGPTLLRVHSGELEATLGEHDTLEIVGPGEEKLSVRGTQVFRVRGEKLLVLEHEPLWLKGYKGTTNVEAMGSLIAQVDGRAVPLTVGYHKVKVDIRDQIARTVIEESFANHTARDMEGIFYFPLPDDASISGFGMWIGNELVEADVVEKQRAREIYETILRERRDPGLLEWTGGNIFKVRVFPIPANAEKRIKISYTQVLPARGNSYRYSYALQSELLKLHPLRELSIDVKVNSAVPLKAILSPTHTVRSDKTLHSAHVEFAAQEYVPTRDFEVVVETERRQADLVLIPHRRGDDGYFMLQLTPPAVGDWQREIIPDGEPLEVLILADTSASIDRAQRRRQGEFVASLLASLTPRDRVNLAGCDADCDWVFEQPVAADKKNVRAIRDFLEERHSLGWTDLDRAFASALAQSGPKTQIIYVGDGIVTARDARPEGFAQRVRLLYGEGKGTCHAVALGNSFEPAVLKAIASLGSGSLRRVSGEERPESVATALLRDVTQPGLSDLKVEFRGVDVARVYPEELPNVPAGSQQILLGLYRPLGRDQTGEVVATAKQGGKAVKFTAKVSLQDAEEGNSFIPRLWAKMHLESLLAQGASQSIRDEVIALSEEFQIMTPYTSFLVLETDADRERFRVQRRFRMRDGEKYFQEGRENANFELVQQQMKRAGNWRLALRRQALAQLATLGRDARVFQAFSSEHFANLGDYGRRSGIWNAPLGSPGLAGLGVDSTYSYLDLDGDGEGLSFGLNAAYAGLPGSGPAGPADQIESFSRSAVAGDLGESEEDGRERGEFKSREIDEKAMIGRPERADLDWFDSRDRGEPAKPWSLGFEFTIPNGRRLFDRELGNEPFGEMAGGYGFGGRMSSLGRRGYMSSPDYLSWINNLFPALPPMASAKKPKPPQPTWPIEAREISESLLRAPSLADLAGGLEIVREAQSFEPRWNELTSRQKRRDLYSPARWLTRTEEDNSQTIVHWADETERGVMGLAFGLGRSRKSAASDLSPAALDRSDYAYLGLNDYSVAPLHEAHRNSTPTIERQEPDRILLILKQTNTPKHETRVLIDSARHVILSIEHRFDGKPTGSTKFDDFVEVAGTWWSRRIEVLDDSGRRAWLITQTVQTVAADEFAGRVATELAPRQNVQFLHFPLPSVLEAKRAQSALGRLTFESQFVLMVHFIRSQQWTRVLEELERCERLAGGKPGMRWVRDAVLSISRRHAELKARLMDAAGLLAEGKLPLAAHKPEGDQPPTGDELFLAEHVLNQAASILEANELLGLLHTVQGVYERQPPHRQAMKGWHERRIRQLDGIGRPDDALREERQLALQYPRDSGLQQRYAQRLFNLGDHEAAFAWLTKAISAPDARWHTHEEDSLRGTYAQFLYQQGRYADLADYLGQWIERSRENSTIYQQYLGALVQADRVPQFEELVAHWLKEGTTAEALSPAAAAQLSAAISAALGQGHYFHTNWIDEKWQQPLADVVLAIARSDRDMGPAQQIMGHWQFHQTDACRRVRAEVLKLLLAGIAPAEAAQASRPQQSEPGRRPGHLPLAPDRIQRMIEWISPNDPAVSAESWREIAKALEARWAAEEDADRRYALGQSLSQVLSAHIGSKELLAFLRRQLAEGPAKFRAAFANQLFNALLSQSWAAPLEDEAFSLLEKLSDSEEPAERLRTQVAALYRLSDAMVNGRNQFRLAQIEHLEQLSAAERRNKTEEELRLAREAFTDRLAQELPRHEGPLVPWLSIERMYFNTLAGRDLEATFRACLDALPTLAVSRLPEADEPPDSEAQITRALAFVLRNRYLTTLAYLATRNGADAGLVDNLLKFIDERLAAEPDVAAWKAWKYEVLVALDRPVELEQALKAWINGEGADSRWRLALAYLQAERGAVPEAISLLEGVEITDELGPAAYRVLAGWYLAANRRSDYERAMVRTFMTLDEWRMSQQLYRLLSPWQRGDQHLPSELDENVLLMFEALFEKSQAPQNYLGQLQQFYQASRDFRLLAVLANSVVGHTAAKVYPFIQGMQGVLNEIRDEATADQLREQIGKVRDRAKTAVDRRALDLLELQVERRAAEIKNQPGPHAAAALAALQRAFGHEWGAGEQRLMADFLAGLGAIADKQLAREQLRHLRELFEGQPRGSFDRLHVGQRLAETVWGAGRPAEATDILRGGLDEFAQSHEGILPVSANNALSLLVSYLDSQRHFAHAERVIREQLKHPVHGQQRLWLTQKLYEVFTEALRNGGEVSLGSGRALYKAIERALLKDLDTPDQNHRYNLVGQLCGLYSIAHDKKLSGAADDLVGFADRIVPDVLKRQTSNFIAMVNQVAATIHDVAGARQALAFLITRVEQQPGWFRFTNQDAWVQFGGTLNSWRIEVGNLGDLDARLLKIVLAELRRDLATQQQRNRDSYSSIHDQRFWREKIDDFARVTDEVYAERKASGAAVQFIADYLFQGLGHGGRAIEILFVAHRDRLLDENGISKLVTFLQAENRFGESIALLERLIDEHPDNLNYRVWLMHAYFRTGRRAELLATLKQTDDYFHEGNRWGEGVLASLGASCLQNQLFEQSAAYYEELIPKHEQSQPNRGVGNGVLSGYYAGLAGAYSGLKKTGLAADAACGAIVSWGRHQANRVQAIEALKNVLRQSADLAAYAAELDQKTNAAAEDRPIVRKALGQVLLEKGQFPRAIAQLQKAIALEPNDLESHQALIAGYDKVGDRQGAIRQLLELADLNRRDIARFKDLAERYTALEKPREAERANTSIVEVQPNESESHALLAEIREKQNRWPEAIDQWREVARLRELEPTGLLHLADAQLHEKQFDEARETLRKLDSTTWPSRFGDIHQQVVDRERRLDKAVRD